MTTCSPDVLQYTISPVQPAAHLWDVHVQFVVHEQDNIRVYLPTWIPGSYMIREFSKNVVTLNARVNGISVTVNKVDKTTWQLDCEPAQVQDVDLHYTVYAWDLSVRTAHLDNTHGFFNGTSVFMCPEGAEQSRCEVHLKPGPVFTEEWKVATGLPLLHGSSQYDGPLPRIGKAGLWLAADDYDALIDHPVEAGELRHASFIAQGVTHHIAVYGAFEHVDIERLCKDLQAVCEHQIAMFEPDSRIAPFKDYWFLVHASDHAYGGLEHRNSTALLCSRKDLPFKGMAASTEEYRTFLGLCSHEYFHSWNVKRIKPAAFTPYRLTAENHTSLLWLFEGFTSYYDDLVLLRTGLMTQAQYLETVAKTLLNIEQAPGSKLQSVAQSSFDAWTKYYRQDENAVNSIVSYYTKGSLVALCLDLHIRAETSQRCSLDDVMRALWNNHGKTGVGLNENELASVILETTGVDVEQVLVEWTEGTDPLPVRELLETFGWHVKPVLGKGVSAGMHATAAAEGLTVKTVRNGSAAEQAGIAAGDVIVALAGFRATADHLKRLEQQSAEGQPCEVLYFRRECLMRSTWEWKAAPLERLSFEALTDQTDWPALRPATGPA